MIGFLVSCTPARRTVRNPEPATTSSPDKTPEKKEEAENKKNTEKKPGPPVMEAQLAQFKKEFPGVVAEKKSEGILLTVNEENGNILFSGNGAVLTATGMNNLDKMAAILKNYRDTDIRIEAHTDDAGTASSNMALSERRVNAVADHLIKAGITPHRLMIRWFGESMPKEKGTSALQRSRNRRMEIFISPAEQMTGRTGK